MSVLIPSRRLTLAGVLLATPIVGMGVSLEPNQRLSEDQSYQVAVADVDGDGDLDLIFGQYASYVDLWLNDGTGQFSNSGMDLGITYASSLYVVDMNNDGSPDLFLGGASGSREMSALILKNNGAGNFGWDKQVSISGQEPGDWTVADVNEDGYPDLVALSRDGSTTKHSTIWVWYGVNGGYKDSPSQYTISDFSCSSVEAADLAGDAGDELVIGCTPYTANGADYPGGIQVWEHNGTQLMELTSVLETDWDIGDIDFTDIDGNGDLDIIGTHFNSATTVSVTGNDHSVWTNSNGTFTPVNLDFEGISLEIDDIDGDGKDDLVIADGSNVRLYLGEAGASFAYQAGAANICSAYAQAVATGDLNNDGRTDLAVASTPYYTTTDPADLALFQDGTSDPCTSTVNDSDDSDTNSSDSDVDDSASGSDSSGGVGLGLWVLLGLLSVVRVKRD